jgi:peroxiredoxin Q/BCP
VAIAGVSSDSLESHQKWTRRLEIPFPLLSDPERRAGEALGLIRRLGIGGWSVELFRRATLLANREGVISAAWTEVKIRGHAAEVLAAARALGR